MLRDYQQSAHDAVIDFTKKSIDPCVIDIACGGGKSHIIAALSSTYNKISGGKRVLCTAPSAELVKQNHAKYIATGNEASMFSSSVGQVSLRHNVTFGTPKTILNRISQFNKKFAAIVIDECHSLTPTIKQIIYYLRENNPNLRVVGTTATPYRLGNGHIYEIDVNGKATEAISPYFKKCVYHVNPNQLIDRGFLTPPKIIAPGEHYDTSKLVLNSMHKYTGEDKSYEGQGRKTSRIIEDIVLKSQGANGVLIYAATIRHAKECMESLPQGISALVTGSTRKSDRAETIAKFNRQEIKYIVNVGVLTTGFDAPHVDVIAILRLTESVSLLQQIIGRGCRVFEGKKHFLLLDYADNISRHCPDGDLFAPEIKSIEKKKSIDITVKCEYCENKNKFSARENKDGFGIDEYGYFTDLRGKRVETDIGPVPAHYGRRCLFYSGTTRCEYRWTMKVCPECETENDIAAKYCTNCKHELVDPNSKLSIFESKENVCHRVITLNEKMVKTKKGHNAILVNFVTKSGVFPVWFMPDHQYLKYDYLKFLEAKRRGIHEIKLISKNGFYKVDKYAIPKVA